MPFYTVESTLFSSCSRFDPPLSRQNAALAHLDSLPTQDLVLWKKGSVPSIFGKGGFGVLFNCSLCGTEATDYFSAGLVYSSFSAEACTILQALCWSRQQQQASHFSSFPDSRQLVFSSVFFTSISLTDLAGTIFSLLLFYQVTMGPRTRFSQETTRLMSWPDGERYLCPLQFLAVSLLSSPVFTLLFSRTGGVLSFINSPTHWFPQFPLRNLCALDTLAVCSLVFPATDTAYC